MTMTTTIRKCKRMRWCKRVLMMMVVLFGPL